MPLFLKYISTQTRHIKSITQNSIAMFSPAGVVPGFSVPKADAMSLSPRRQGINAHFYGHSFCT
jgi:hypothetical protein